MGNTIFDSKTNDDKEKDRKYSITTLSSHCSLQVLKGAKDEGFKTILICEEKRLKFYKRFKFIDDFIILNNFREIVHGRIQNEINQKNTILIPHGTLISSLNSEEIEKLNIPIFGNKWILRWESDRLLKQKLMEESLLNTPKPVKNKFEIKNLSIVKLNGAAGGKGYFLAWDKKSFESGASNLINQKMIKDEDELYIQEFIMGVPVYFQFFYSPITDNIELLGIDRRYESDIDGIGRIPSATQLNAVIEPTYQVIGNFPLVLRESLLYEAYEMGERFVKVSKKMISPGMNGPFCLEGVYDRNGKFTTFEFSARIVAGTNLYVGGSPYSDLLYDEPMSMGKRIAKEIKLALQTDNLSKIVT